MSIVGLILNEDYLYLSVVRENEYCEMEYFYYDRLVDSKKIAEQRLDETEALDVIVVPFERAIDMVMTNEICCNSSELQEY